MGLRRAKDESAQPTTASPGPTAAGPAVTSSQASLLSIQRSAGNRAVGALLGRPPAAAPDVDVDAILRRALDDVGAPDADVGGGAAPAAPEAAEKTPAQKYAEHEEELYGPGMDDIGVDGVNKEKAESDLAALSGKLSAIPALKDTDFLKFMHRYVRAAMKGEGGLALEMMYSALACLDSVGAFTVGAVHYRKFGTKPTPAELGWYQSIAMSNVHLWSKLEKYLSIDTVKGGETGLSLESSAAGSLFDGLTFGMEYKTNKVLGQQWKLVSKTFVSQSMGVVHAQVLRGIDESSVLFKTEWPEIKKLIEEKKVVHLVVHFFDLVDGNLVEKGEPRIVHNQAEFDAIERVSVDTDAEYKQVQSDTWKAETARAKKAMAAATARIEQLDVPPT